MEIVDVLAKMDERLARQDDILAQLVTTLARMDDRLAKQDDTLRLIETHMARLGEFMAACHHEAAAAHQASAVAMTRLAKQALALDRTLDDLTRHRRQEGR